MSLASQTGGSAHLDSLADSLQAARQARSGQDATQSSGLVPVLERLTSRQWPAAAPVQPPDAADTGAACPHSAKRRAVLRQVRAQREALALLSRNAPVPPQLLQAVGPPTEGLSFTVSSFVALVLDLS